MRKYGLITMSICLALFSCGGSDSPSKPAPETRYDFALKQEIATSGAADFEAFDIGADHYLAVANASSGASLNIDSKIYLWSADTAFVEIQAIPTSQASDWEHFTIGADHYLAVANLFDGASYNIDSRIYRWNGTQFVEIQAIRTHGALDWKAFTIGTDHFLAVANSYNGSSANIDSRIYRWDGTAFVEFQSILTNSAHDWEYFMIGTESCLAVANSNNGTTNNVDSKVYRYNGTTFLEVQAIATHGAADWESFSIGGDVYLACAFFSNDDFNEIDSKIYRWTGTAFGEIQSIPTKGALDWESFTIEGFYYLAVANYTDETTDYTIDSEIYIWDGAEFVPHQSVPTAGANDWEAFLIGDVPFLACANLRGDSGFNLNSIILEGLPEQ